VHVLRTFDVALVRYRDLPRENSAACLLPAEGYNERMPRGEEMKPAAPGVKLTYDDFLLFPDDGQRHELIDGEHYVTPSPASVHQRIVGNIHFRMRQFLEAHPAGEVFLAPFDVVFGEHDVVEPDLLYISASRRDEILTKLHVRGVPDLVIEVGSPGTRKRDETIKRHLYERTGVAEYWVIDPELELVRVYRWDEGSFSRPTELTRESGDVLVSTVLAGFELPLVEIFRIPV
jgi:Uma2 family endonuclease